MYNFLLFIALVFLSGLLIVLSYRKAYLHLVYLKLVKYEQYKSFDFVKGLILLLQGMQIQLLLLPIFERFVTLENEYSALVATKIEKQVQFVIILITIELIVFIIAVI